MSVADTFSEISTEEPPPSEDWPTDDSNVDNSGDGGGEMSPSDGTDTSSEPPPSEGLPQPTDGGDSSLPPGTPGGPEGPPAPTDGGDTSLPPGTPGGPESSPSPSEMPGSGGENAPGQPGETLPDSPGTTPIDGAPNHDLPGLSGVLDWIRQRISDIQQTVSDITTHITDGIAGIIEGLVPPTIVALTGITGVIGNLVQGFLNQLAPTVEVGQMIQDSLTGGIPMAFQGFFDSLWHERGDELNALLDHLGALEGMPDPYRNLIASARSGTPIALIPVAVGLAIFALHSFADATLQPEIRATEYLANRVNPNRLPSHPELIEAIFRGNLGDNEFSELLAQHGFGDEMRGILIGNRMALFDTDRLLELWRRGVIDEDTLNAGLFKLGIQGEMAAQTKQLSPFLPSPQDLVHFMTRDAFFDTDDGPFGNVVRDFQLDFGEDSLPFDWFARVGVTPETVKLFWRSHWEIPGRHDANEMFFRGKLGDRNPGGDGERILERVYRAKGIEPIFIKPLIQTAFKPLGRIDIRRMVKAGSMDRDGAIEAYQQIGYNTDNATLLADLAIQLASQESAAEKEPFRSGLKSRIVAAFINGTLSQDETITALSDLHYHDDSITQFVAEADVERHAILAGHIRQGVERLYTSGEWERDHAAQYLQERGFADAEIGQLLEWWAPIRELRDLREEHKQHKEVTRGDILTAYHDDIIDRDTAFVHLTNLGYTDNDAEMLLSHTDHQKVKSDMTAMIEGTHAAFGDRQLDIQGALHELDQIGVSGNRRDALLRKWQAELDRRLPDIPLSMVEKLAVAKLYTIEELKEELNRRHFNNDQIEKFARLWGFEISVVSRRAATQSEHEAEALQRKQLAEQRRHEAEQRRIQAHADAEKRRIEADIRRHEADARRAENDARRAANAGRAEHDRLTREAHAGRLSIGRIRTAFVLGIITEDNVRTLMAAIGLRPEAIQVEMEILHEQQRAKQSTASSTGSSTSPAPVAAALGP